MMLLEELEAFKGGGGGSGGGGRGGSSRRKNKNASSINYFAIFSFLVVLFFLPAMFLNTKKK
jgi:hypothetical protein